MAKIIAQQAASNDFLAAVGTPMCVTSLDEGILDKLEVEGRSIRRMPLSELMWFLWKDNGNDEKVLNKLKDEMAEISDALGTASPFAADPDALFVTANKVLPDFAGAFGRYRYAKALQMGETAKAVLAMAPRYENTAMALQLSHITENCAAPVFDLSLDGDWDDSGWARLRSFLHYC